MPIENIFRQDTDTENPKLCDAFGVQATHGLPVVMKIEGGQTSFISFLAAGECNRALKVYYGAFLLTEFTLSGVRQWRFHKGTSSDGFDDPEQGRPEFFPELDETFTEITYIEVRPPADFGEIDPRKLFVVFEGKVVDDYALDGSGDLIVAGRSFSANNFRVRAHIERNNAFLPLSRYHGATALAFRDECDELIPWVGGEGDGLRSDYYNTTDLTGAIVATKTEPFVDMDYTNGARVDGVAASNFSVRFSGEFKSPTTETITFITTADDGCRLWVNGVLLVDDFGGGAARENYAAIALNEGVKYAIVLEYHQYIGPGIMRLEYSSPTIERQVIPIDRLYSAAGDRMIPQFTAHVAFPTKTEPAIAVENVMMRAPSVHCQDVGINGQLKLKFEVGTDRPVVHTFFYDPTQTTTRSNIAYKSFQTYPRPDEETPDFFHVAIRDVDRIDEILPQRFIPIDRPQLRVQRAGFRVDLGVVPLGVMHYSLGERIGETMMRLQTDLGRFVVVRGQRDAHHVAKGCFVEVVHDIPRWRLPRLFIVIEESFPRGKAGERDFLLQAISPEFYSKTAHGAIPWGVRGDLITPFVPPPPIEDVDPLAEGLRIMPDGAAVSTIEGTITAAEHPHAQRVRVWIKMQGDLSFRLTDRILIPDASTRQASFMLEGIPAGTHQLKFVSELSAGGLRLPFDEHSIWFVTVTNNLVPTPSAPSGFTGNALGQSVRWEWNAPPVEDRLLHSHFEMFTDAALTSYANGGRRIDTTFLIENIAGLGAYNRWIVAVNKAGKRSASATATATVSTVPVVTGLALSFDGEWITATWNEVANAQERIIGYYIYDGAGTRIDFAERPPYRIRASAASTTLQVKAVDRSGNVSPAFATYTLAQNAPAAPPQASITVERVNNELVWRWNPSATPGVVAYEVQDQAGAILRTNIPIREFRELVASGQASYTRRFLSIDRFGQKSTAYSTATFTQPTPDPPPAASIVGEWIEDEIVWRWNPSATAAVVAYEVQDSAGNILRTNIPIREFREAISYGTAAYTRRFLSIDLFGQKSATYSQATLNMPVPAAPAGSSASFNGDEIVWIITPAASANADRVSHYRARTNTGASVPGADRLTDLRFAEAIVQGTASYTRRFYSINEAGIESAGYFEQTFTISPPVAPASVAGAWNGTEIVWSWPASVSLFVSHYEVRDASDRLLDDRRTSLSFPQSPIYGVTSYGIRIYAVNRAGLRSAAFASNSFTLPTPDAPRGYALAFTGSAIEHRWNSGITWQNVVNFTVGADNSLTKNSSTASGWNGAAVSTDALSGDGFVEAQASVGDLMIGLGVETVLAVPTFQPIDFAFYPTSGGALQIYENGTLRGTFGTWIAGDVFRVAAENGLVKYYKNGTLLYTSTVSPTFPLYVQAAGWLLNGKISGARLVGRTLLEYEIATDAAFTNTLARVRGNFYSEVPANNIARGVVSRYIRAVASYGTASASTNATFTNSAPPAPTITKDATRDIPNSLTLHNTTTIARALIRATIAQIRVLPGGSFPASTAEGTDRVFRWSGAPAELNFEWPNGGQIEIRIAHEDLFSPQLLDHQFSLISHSFRLFGSAEIGRLGDVNFDTTSALARLIASRNQIPITGGGDIRWGAGQANGEAVKWILSANMGADARGIWSTVNSAFLYGGYSEQTFSGACAVEFTVDDPLRAWFCGLDANRSASFGYSDIDFAIHCSNGDTGTAINVARLGIYESGVLKWAAGIGATSNTWGTVAQHAAGNNSIRVGDVFRITRDAGGVVRYYQNGTLIYTSAVAGGAGALGVDTSFAQAATSRAFRDVRFEGTIGTANLLTWSDRFIAIPVPREIASEGFVNFPASSATLTGWQGLIGRISMPAAAVAAFQNLVGVETDANGTLRKLLSVAAGWGNAGASTTQTIGLGGYVEASATRAPNATAGQVREGGIIGLSANDADQNYTSIQFGINLQSDGILYVYESGVLRGSVGTWGVGDVIRVEKYFDPTLARYAVKYLKNGALLYTSTVTPGATLRGDFSLYNPGDEIGFLRIVPTTTGATPNATMIVVDYPSYTPPAPQSRSYDFTVAVNNQDNNKLYLFDGRVLEPGQVIRAGAFFPQASIGQAFIQNAAIVEAMIGALEVKDAHIDTVRANKVLAQLLDAFIVFADSIGSRNFVAAGDTTPQTEIVEFQDLVNTSALSDGTLQKTGGVDQAWDAGARATRALAYGDGYIEVTVPSVAVTNIRYFGFTRKASVVSYADLKFGLGITSNDSGGNGIRIYEDGVQRASNIALAAGDVLRVEVAGGSVLYKRNGATIYTSTIAPMFPLYVGVAMYHAGGILPRPNLRGVLMPATPQPAKWTNLINVQFDSSDNPYRTKPGATWEANGSGLSSVDTLTGDFIVQANVPLTTNAMHYNLGVSTADVDASYSAQYSIHPFAQPYQATGTWISIYESGVNKFSQNVGWVPGDVVSVSREGGVIKYRFNGTLLYTSTVTSGATLVIDAAIYEFGTKIPNIRFALAGAIAQGWKGDPSGLLQVGKGIRIGREDLFEVAARSLGALGSDLRYEGNDVAPFLPHKVSSIELDSFSYSRDDFDLVQFSLAANWTGYQLDAFANGDSIRQCLCRVYDKFGALVKEFRPFTFIGDGICAYGKHAAKYADPQTEAIYELRFRNKFDWSRPVFFQNGTLSLTMPTLQRRLDAPLELNGAMIGYGAGSTISPQYMFRLGWRVPAANSGTIGIYVRLPHQTAFGLFATVAAGVNFYEFDTFIDGLGGADTYFDVRVLNNSVAGAFSNIVRIRLPQQYAVPADNPPLGVAVSLDSATAATVRWTPPIGGIAPAQYYVRRVRVSTGFISSQTVVGATTYQFADMVQGERYIIAVQAQYSGTGRTSPSSRAVVFDMPSSMNASDPTNLAGMQRSNTQVDYTWNLNSAVGSVSFDYEAVAANANFAGAWTTVALAAGTASYTLANIASTVGKIRARVRVSDAGTVSTNYFDVIIIRIV